MVFLVKTLLLLLLQRGTSFRPPGYFHPGQILIDLIRKVAPKLFVNKSVIPTGVIGRDMLQLQVKMVILVQTLLLLRGKLFMMKFYQDHRSDSILRRLLDLRVQG